MSHHHKKQSAKQKWEAAHPGLGYLSDHQVKKWLSRKDSILKRIANRPDVVDFWNKYISKGDDRTRAAWLKMQNDNMRIDREKKIAKPFKVLLDLAAMPGKVAAFSPLLPFLPAMKRELKKRGVSVPGSKLDIMENTARQFVQVVILKRPAFTKGVGLASLEGLDLGRIADGARSLSQNGNANIGADGKPTPGNTMVDKGVDMAVSAIGKAGPIGSIIATAAQIVHAIVNFFIANKKKADAEKKRVKANLSPDEADALQHQEGVNYDIASSTDKIQNALVTAGVGNVKADGTIVQPDPDYGHGLFGFFRRLFHTPLHRQNLENFLEALEDDFYNSSDENEGAEDIQ